MRGKDSVKEVRASPFLIMANNSWYWVGLLILVVAIAIAVAVIAWSSNHKKIRFKPGLASLTADDVQTGEIQELAVVTGLTGAASDSGFLTVLSTTIRTEACTNRLYSNVSAFTSMATLDASVAAGGSSITTEVGSVEVRVLVDGVLALPGSVQFDTVVHVFSSTLGEEEFYVMVEQQGEANSFDFVTRDVLPGSHTVEVQARALAVAASIGASASEVVAIIGDRTLVVQPGRVATACNPCPTIAPPTSPSSSSSSSST